MVQLNLKNLKLNGRIILFLAILLLNGGLGWYCVYWYEELEQWNQTVTVLETYAPMAKTIEQQPTCWTEEYLVRKTEPLNVVQHVAEAAGLQVESIKAGTNKESSYELELKGTYAGLIYFLNEIEKEVPMIDADLQSIERAQDTLKITVIVTQLTRAPKGK